MTMAHKSVVSDPEKCTGCRLCELACSAIKEKGFSPLLSRIRTVHVDNPILLNMAIACVLCEKAPCVTSCPTKALLKSESGIIRVDEKKCNGCSWCIAACKFGAIASHFEKNTVMICDLCEGSPKCVEFCPKEALSLKTAEEIGQQMRRKVVKKLLEQTPESTKG